MSKGRRPLLMLLMVLGLTAASLVAIALRPAVLGLDLQGGVEVILEGRPTAESPVTPEAIDRSIEVIRSRVDAFGVTEPEIQKQGTNQIAVSLPGADDPSKVVTDLIKPAQLFFYDFQDSVVGQPYTDLLAAVKATQSPAVRIQHPDRGAKTLYAFAKAKTGTFAKNALVAGPVTVTPGVEADATRELRTAVRAAKVDWSSVNVEAVPKGLTVVRQQQDVLQTRQNGPKTTQYYIFQDNPGLSGKDITNAASTRDLGQGRSGEPIVTMQFTDAGRDKFKSITQALATRGSLQGEDQSFSIVLDGELISNPTVDYKQYPDGIDGNGGAQIQGSFTSASAKTLADQLNSGAIPIRLEPVSQKRVSATLGKESLRQGLIAGVVGLAVTILFLIVYYRFLGLIAALGLLIYAAYFYAAVVLVPITLTLPGIAGVILTIGVAADANIVIFERVREEARSGKSPQAALAAGYRRGIHAIVDANVVTLVTALIVFLFATGGPRGFAFTLAIGVLLSLFTAVIGTQAIFGVLSHTRLMQDEKVMGFTQGRVPNWQWVKRWRLWLVVSTVPVLFGLVWLGASGLNMGLDFKSGTSITTAFTKPTTEAQLRQTLSRLGYPDAKVQAYEETLNGKAVSGFQIETKSLSADEQSTLQNTLDQRFGINRDTFQLDQVGPTFGRQIIRNAIQAIILSFIVVALYLMIRFEYRLALPAMLSVVHDVALTVGVYAVTGREVTSATVAAILTILGYSLYDVVIVFDRIRENVPRMRGARYRDIVDRSLNETFTRSLITSLSTLLPVLALFFFGGETLKDFSFALLVGVLAGGISSIVISAPLAAAWKEREPAEKRRKVKAERKLRLAMADADVVDVDVLARAEQSLDAEDRGWGGSGMDEGRHLPAETAVASDDETAPPATGADGDGSAPAPAPDAEGARPDGAPARPRRDRPRRHQEIQQRRRKR